MRALKGKHGFLGIATSQEYELYSRINFDGFMQINEMDEHQAHMADELYKRNLLRKVRRGTNVGYSTYGKEPLQ